ncbi:MAG: hypothetical protein FWC79_01715 [Oscillospiraceae bacterium]|nr:hypothetical protein [Oscillospiraceae bacterium]
MKKSLKILFAIILLTLLGMFITTVYARTEIVSDGAELTAALNDAGVSVILLEAGDFLVTPSFSINRALTINTVGNADATIRRLSGNIFNVANTVGSSLTIENGPGGGSITISGNQNPGTGINLAGANSEVTIGDGVNITQFGSSGIRATSGGTVTMNGTARIHHNSSNTAGGGVAVEGGALFIMNGGSIDNNTAQSWGGGIRFHNGGTFRMYDGIVTGNISHRGGGGFSGGGSEVNRGRLYVMGGVISNNTVTGLGDPTGSSFGGGGGIFADGAAVVTVSSGRIYGNSVPYSAVGRGAGVFLNLAASLNLSGDAIIENNIGAPRGGGIHLNNVNSRLHMSGGTIRNNEATNGGGIYVLDGRIYMTGGTISGSNATEEGGGIRFHQPARITITDGVIEGNSADNGGAIFVEHTNGTIPHFIIGEEVIFRNNTARVGRYVNNLAAAANLQINPKIVTVYPHAFSNYDINVLSGNLVAIITFEVRNGARRNSCRRRSNCFRN